jgi:hypothetical protein
VRVDPERLVFVDETWAKTNMTRTHGRAARGQRLIGRVPHGRWTTMTFLAGLRVQGIIAPCVIDGPINGPMFLAWVTQFLVRPWAPGDIVVLDNLDSHKSHALRRAIRDAGAHRLLLPPYSPDLNRSSRPSPSSRPCFEKPTSIPPTLSGNASVHCSIR